MQALALAIDKRANEIYAGEGYSQDLADAKDLARALARMLAGQSVRVAFGSTGDWGYSTPIGKALAQLYSEATA
jgi:hypothetical protein